MPTYQYACTACDHGFEVVQAFTDEALSECPECRGRLRKVFGAVGVVFKGSGFYRTDSREKPKSETAGKGDKPDAAAKGDVKPATSDGASGGTPGTSGGTSSPNGSSGSATSKTPSTAGSAA